MKKIEELFRRYLNDQCSPDEVQMLMHYFRENDNEGFFRDLIYSELEKPEGQAEKPTDVMKITERILGEINKKKRKKK